MLQANTSFIGLFGAAMVIIVIFLAAAYWSAMKRGLTSELKEVLLSMVRHPLFWSHAGIAFGAIQMSQWEVLFGTCISYLVLQFAAAEFLTLKNGTYQYQFFEASWLNTWASAIISTKTVFALVTVIILWVAGYKGTFEAGIVGERILEIVIAWGGANSIAWVTGLKGKDMSFLNPKKPTLGKPIQQPAYASPVALPSAPESPSVEPVVSKPLTKEEILLSTRPPYIAFDSENFKARLVKFVAAQMKGKESEVALSIKYLEFRYVSQVALGDTCWYPLQLSDFATWFVNLAYFAFDEKFGFSYQDVTKHFDDVNLLKCPVTDMDSFLFALSGEHKEVYREVSDAISDFNIFAFSFNRFGMEELALEFATGRWTLWDAFQNINQLK